MGSTARWAHISFPHWNSSAQEMTCSTLLTHLDREEENTKMSWRNHATLAFDHRRNSTFITFNKPLQQSLNNNSLYLYHEQNRGMETRSCIRVTINSSQQIRNNNNNEPKDTMRQNWKHWTTYRLRMFWEQSTECLACLTTNPVKKSVPSVLSSAIHFELLCQRQQGTHCNNSMKWHTSGACL